MIPIVGFVQELSHSRTHDAGEGDDERKNLWRRMPRRRISVSWPVISVDLATNTWKLGATCRLGASRSHPPWLVFTPRSVGTGRTSWPHPHGLTPCTHSLTDTSRTAPRKMHTTHTTPSAHLTHVQVSISSNSFHIILSIVATSLHMLLCITETIKKNRGSTTLAYRSRRGNDTPVFLVDSWNEK